MKNKVSEMIGGGRTFYVPISSGKGAKETVVARGGLLGSSIGVITQKSDWQGMVLMPRWKTLEKLITTTRDILKIKWTPDKIGWQKFSSIYYAIRETYHILVEKYGVGLESGEKALMLESIEAAQNLNLAVIGLRKENEKIYQEKLSQLVDQIVERVGETHYNLFIQEGLDYLKNLWTMRDSSGKVSETVKMVQSQTGKRRFTGRLNEILHIQPVIEERRAVLISLRDLIEYRLLKTRHFLDLIKEKFNLERFILEQTQRQRIVTHLNQIGTEIGQIDVQPYVFTCQMIEKELKQAANYIQKQEVNEAIILINRSLESLKLKVIQKEIEELIENMTVLLSKKQVGEPYKLKGEVTDIIRKLGQISEEGFALKTKEKVIRELNLGREYLEGKILSSIDLAKNSLKQASDYMQAMP